jgi:hypothetical protein
MKSKKEDMSRKLSGQGTRQSRFCGALAAAHPLPYSPGFAAPVMRDETNGGEMLLIRAELGT